MVPSPRGGGLVRARWIAYLLAVFAVIGIATVKPSHRTGTPHTVRLLAIAGIP